MAMLERKLKIAAFDTAIKGLLKNKEKEPDRTARNILELASALSGRTLDEAGKKEVLSQLKRLLPEKEETIRNYLMDYFENKGS